MRSRMSVLRRVLLVVAMPAVVALAGIQLGCASPQTMRSSDAVPASQGTVKATQGDNGNMNVAIRVKHLALSSRVAADATVYVVWIQPRNAAWQSVGALTLNDNLEGALDTVTPHHRFRVMVTPEPTREVAQPTHEPVFTADVERPE